MSSRKSFMMEPLVAWVKTFDSEVASGPLNTIDQLTSGVYLLQVIATVENEVVDPDIILSVSTSNDRLHNYMLLFQHIKAFYNETLFQLVMLTPPDIVRMSQDPRLESCQGDMLCFLLLLLGCATQCERKDDYIDEMHQLPEDVKQALMNCFTDLAENTMSANESALDLDDKGRGMYSHMRRLVEERDRYLQAYFHTFEQQLAERSIQSSPRHLTTQQAETDLQLTKKKMQSLLKDLDERSSKVRRVEDEMEKQRTIVEQLRTENSRLALQSKSGVGMKQKLDQAADKVRQAEKFESEVYRLRQQLSEMDFYRKRVQELRDDNSGLIEEKQRLEDLLTNSRKKEEDVIERLVECQMRLDEMQSERDFDRRRITELMEENTALDNDLRQWRVEGVASSGVRAQQESEQTNRANELQREVEILKTRLMEAQKQVEQKEDRWKFLETQKEKLEVRRELVKVKEHAEKERGRLADVESRLTTVQKEKEAADQDARLQRSAHEEHTRELEAKISEMTNQIMLLRRKGAKLANAQFREMEATEMELMYKSVQELTTQMSRLKANNRILRKSCDKLKEDVDKILTMEEENERLKRENRDLRKSLSSHHTTSEQEDELRRRNLQLEIENKKLRRIIESLRMTLVQIDPYNRMKYHYITSI